jgi:acyl-[acyl-carrier-protein] desaturase
MTAAIQNDVLSQLEGFAEEMLPLLKSVQDSWQPSDFLPDMTQEDWQPMISALRQKTAGITDEVLAVLVGNTITEEALPAYQTSLSRIHGLSDDTGAGQSAWAVWMRGWTAEEKRHGDLLSRYLYLSGRVNTRSVEVTTQNLIRNGFNSRSENDPYKSFVYVSFQERATKISHANTGKLAEKCGDPTLARICSAIAKDEARHEEAYKRFFNKIVVADPENAVIAFAQMMEQRVSMPALLMSDGTDCDLFSQFALVAQRIGVYTIRDYGEVMQHLVDTWGIASLAGLTGEAAKSQEYVCQLPARYALKADRIQETLSKFPRESFEWIFGRKA